MTQEKAQLTVQEAATRVGCTSRTLYRWMECGELAFVVQDNGRRLISSKDLLKASKSFCERKPGGHGAAEWHSIRATLNDVHRLLQEQTRLLHSLVELYRPETLEALNRKRDILSKNAIERN